MTQEEYNVAVVDAWHYQHTYKQLFGFTWEKMEEILRWHAWEHKLQTTIFATLVIPVA